jgi:hypothetical protein
VRAFVEVERFGHGATIRAEGKRNLYLTSAERELIETEMHENPTDLDAMPPIEKRERKIFDFSLAYSFPLHYLVRNAPKGEAVPNTFSSTTIVRGLIGLAIAIPITIVAGQRTANCLKTSSASNGEAKAKRGGDSRSAV